MNQIAQITTCINASLAANTMNTRSHGWIQLHLNVPASGEGTLSISLRRLRWLALGALVPEFLLLAAGSQWASAKRSVKDMKDIGQNYWTIALAFYANGGGFVCHAPGVQPFPANAKQIHYLVRNRYTAIPDIGKEEILDKSKGDKVTKTIACLQTFWFLTQCAARLIQHLPVSPLELQTCAIVLCTLTTYFFWLHKPLDVYTPTIITIETPISSLLVSAGPAAKEAYKYTPLNFVEPEAHIMTIWPCICRYYGPFKAPLRRIPNDRNPCLYSIYQRAYLGFNVICFSTISFTEWHFPFPSSVELLWRYACMIAESALFVHAACEVVGNRRRRQKFAEFPYVEGYKLQWPKGVFLFWLPLLLYLLARFLILGLSVLSLRNQPAVTFTKVSWSDILPHAS